MVLLCSFAPLLSSTPKPLFWILGNTNKPLTFAVHHLVQTELQDSALKSQSNPLNIGSEKVTAAT